MNWRDAWTLFTQLFSVTMPNESNRLSSIINYINSF